MSPIEPVAVEPQVASAGEEDRDFGAEMSDGELGELLVREITIDGMCGVY